MTAPAAVTAQLLPGGDFDGVIEVGYNAVEFFAADIMTVEEFEHHGAFHTHVALLPRFDSRVAALTAGKVGYEIWFTLCGRKIINARLQTELSEATFVHSTPDSDEAQAVAAFIRNPPCASL